MSDHIIPNGYYDATVLEAALGVAKSGTDQVAVRFTLSDTAGEFASRTINWYGSLTDRAEDITFEALTVLGFDDSRSLKDMSWMIGQPARLKIEVETYEGKERSKVRFVNRPMGDLVKTPMDATRATSLEARLRARAKSEGLRGTQKSQPQHVPLEDTPF